MAFDKKLVKDFPSLSGVYVMKDVGGEIIYIGKAKNLKKRVSSYFLANRDAKTSVLVSKIESIEVIATNSEYEALLLENNLIKAHSPRYNICLKDGKTYPVIRITDEEFPRVFRTRDIVNDNSLYFGPYTQVGLVDLYLELIKRIFHIRKCRGKLKRRDYPCLYFHLNMCKAPCIGGVSSSEYRKEVDEISRVLSGDSDDMIAFLKEKIEAASATLDYEMAKVYRDFLLGIEAVTSSQDVVDNFEGMRDFVAYYVSGETVIFCVLQMRNGKLLGKDIFRIKKIEYEDELIEQFLMQFYQMYHEPPETIVLGTSLDLADVEKYFRNHLVDGVSIVKPEGKHDSAILNMALSNCKIDADRQKSLDRSEGLKELKEIFNMKREPRIIEGFDIAHLHGKHTVSSLIYFKDGLPSKKDYRKFKLRSLDGKIDDFESMREVTARRYTRLLNEKKRLPDLILIDGGQGQVNAVYGILKSLNIEDITLLGLAKKNEEIFIPHNNKPYVLPEGNPALRILQNVRDEAHRFATSFNQQLRKKGEGL